MPDQRLLNRWLPIVIALFGFLFSILIFYFLTTDAERYFGIHHNLEDHTPWLALIFGVSFSLLIGIMIRVAQLAHERAISLKISNEQLKNEIAERVLAEEGKQKLESALLQGQKLQAIGTMAGGIAHDFNNILYAILGYIELAREDVPKDSLAHKNLGKALEGAHRGQELVSRILAFSRRQHHHYNALNLRTTIESALSLIKPTIPASVLVKFTPVDFYALGNQTQIHQIIVNIVNNAVDAMEGEGEIELKMTVLEADDPLLDELIENHTQRYCKIEISDTGLGMDKKIMDRIFEPFFTTKEVGKGTGLGLSIVHSIIKEHEGEISVESQLGKGTTFTILLPEYKI